MFEQIKKNSPKAWEKFEIHMYRYMRDDLFYAIFRTTKDKLYNWKLTSLTSLIGHLLLFFDEQGIRIIIEDTIIRHNFKYKINVYDDQKQFNYQEFDIADYPSRTEAWEAAFTKAFNIYEKILEGK